MERGEDEWSDLKGWSGANKRGREIDGGTGFYQKRVKHCRGSVKKQGREEE